MGLFAAWVIGEGIIFQRWAKAGAPPTPGALASSSLLFAALAVIGIYQPARMAVTVTAFGLDLAVLLQVIGNNPPAQTGWPPPFITDPTVVIPTKGPNYQPPAETNASSSNASAQSANGNIWSTIWNDLNLHNL